jgi:hypothetical protein
MRAASPLIVVLVVMSWVLPQQAGAKTPIPSVDRVVRKAVAPRTDPVDDLRREVEAVVNTASAVVERAPAPAPDVSVTSAPAAPQVVSAPRPDTTTDFSPPQRSEKRSARRTQKAHKRSPTRRHQDRAETPTLLARDTRQPDKRRDIYRVAAAGNEIHPTEVKGLTLTASRQTGLAVTGVYLLTWMAAGLFLIGLGTLSLVTSRPRLARLSLRA